MSTQHLNHTPLPTPLLWLLRRAAINFPGFLALDSETNYEPHAQQIAPNKKLQNPGNGFIMYTYFFKSSAVEDTAARAVGMVRSLGNFGRTSGRQTAV